MTPTLPKQLEEVFNNWQVCKKTGTPLNSNKVYFNTINLDFNEDLQIDFLFIEELGSMPILYMVDMETSLSDTVIMASRNLSDAAAIIKIRWFNKEEPRKVI